MRSFPMSLIIATFVGIWFFNSAEAAENWPQFRGPAGDGQTDCKTLPLQWSETENVRWKTAIHGRGWSSPVIWGNQIWLTTATEDGRRMFGICLDKTSGKILHDLLLFENKSPSDTKKYNSYASPTPVIEEGRVYCSFGSYGTACVDTTTGKVLWRQRDLVCDHFRGPGSSPILFENLLIMNFDGFDFQYVVALDKKTGHTAWKTARSTNYRTDNGDFKKAFSTPTVIRVGDQPQLISTGAKGVLAYEPRTGKEIWKVHFNSHSAAVRPLFDGQRVYLSTGFSKADLIAIRPDGKGDITESHVAWTLKKSIPRMSSPVLIAGKIYLVDDQGVTSCVDAKSGKQNWKGRAGGNYSASTLTDGERVYCFSREGKATIFQTGDKYKVLAANQLDSGFRASPAVSGKALYLRSLTHLYRIEADEK